MKHKIINWIICLLFLCFAYVQLNDPDPVIWVITYVVVALLFGLVNYVHIPNTILYLIIVGTILFALYHIGYFYDWMLSDEKAELFGEMKSDRYYIEGTREFLGLLIALTALFYLKKQN